MRRTLKLEGESIEEIVDYVSEYEKKGWTISTVSAIMDKEGGD